MRRSLESSVIAQVSLVNNYTTPNYQVPRNPSVFLCSELKAVVLSSAFAQLHPSSALLYQESIIFTENYQSIGHPTAEKYGLHMCFWLKHLAVSGYVFMSFNSCCFAILYLYIKEQLTNEIKMIKFINKWYSSICWAAHLITVMVSCLFSRCVWSSDRWNGDGISDGGRFGHFTHWTYWNTDRWTRTVDLA